jgi:hypothetical protein
MINRTSTASFDIHTAPRWCATLLVVGLGLLSIPALAAGPAYWDWPEARSFDELKLEGTALNGEGQLVGGLVARSVGPEGSEVYWALAEDGDGGFYTGAGHDGSIYHTDSQGRTKLYARVEASEVLSLMYVRKSGLYVGTGPEGRLFHLDSSGKGSLLGTVEGGYVWSLASGTHDDEIWAAAGAPAALYRYTAGGGLEAVVTLPATNALDVAWAPDGRLVLSTQGPGLVYRLDPEQPESPELLFETPQDEVRQLIAGPGGELYFFSLMPLRDGETPGSGAGPGGQGIPPSPMMMLFGGNGEPKIPRAALWRLGGDGTVQPVWSGEDDLMIVAWSAERGWLAGGPLATGLGQSQLLQLTPPAGSHPVAGWSGGDVLDILLPQPGRKDGEILVSQGHPQMVVALSESGTAERVAYSPTLDAKRPAHWGRLRWSGSGDVDDLRWSVRGGNRSVPDESWSQWTESWNESDHELDLAAFRFLQWRVVFGANSKNDPAQVSVVSVSAWLDNSAPSIMSFEEERLQGIESGGLVSHSENLTQVFKSGLKAEFDRPISARNPVPARAAAASRAVRIFSWNGSDPDEDRLVYQLEYRPEGKNRWRPVGKESQETMGGWDTSEVPDGRYQVRLTASDRLDNPGRKALSTHRFFGTVVVDNTAPEISKLRVRRIDTGLRVSCRAEDQWGVLASARIRLPDGSYWRLDPTDLVCDSRRESFDLEFAWPQPGLAPGVEPWSIRVEVQDMNGNMAAAEQSIDGAGE